MQHRRAVGAGAGGVLVLAMTLASMAGCTRGEAKVTSESDEIPAVDINPQERDKLKKGGTLDWPISKLPSQWNVSHLEGATVPTATVTDALLPSPFRFDEKANPVPNPGLVQSAKLTQTEPKQVVTYELNPEAEWSDGKPITWRDFRSQWKALNGEDQRFESAASVGYSRIGSVKKGENAREVVVTYDKPFGDWEATFDPLLPRSTTSDPEVFNNGWMNQIPVTAGPFRVEGIDKDANTVTLTRDPDWWGNPAKLRSIKFHVVPESKQMRAYKQGKIDFVKIGTNGAAYKAAKTIPKTELRKAAAPDYAVVTFNGSSPMLSNVDVRKAIAMAVDRERIAHAALKSVDWPTIPMQNHFFVNTQDGYRNNAGILSEPDRKKARQLLNEAGWKAKKKQQVRTKDGDKLELTFVSPKGSDRSEQVGRLMRSMLAKIGVKLTIEEVPMKNFFDKYITAGKFDLAPSAWQGTPFPVSSSRPIYAMPTKDPRGDLVIQQNFSRIGSSRIDSIMADAISTLDAGEARKQANKADRMIWDAVHSLPLYQQPQIRAVRQNLANFGANGFQSIIHQNIGFLDTKD